MNFKDKQIINLLQKNGKLSYAEIGTHVDLSITAVKERIKKLKNEQVIEGNVYLLNPKKLGLEVCAFVQVLMPVPSEEENFIEKIRNVPEVQECHSITGEYSYLLKVRVENTNRLEQLMSEKITSIKGVVRTSSIIALTTFKEITQVTIN